MPEFLNYLWQCEDVNGLQGFGINPGLLICPLYSHRISNGQFGITSSFGASHRLQGKGDIPLPEEYRTGYSATAGNR
jgi:hypothetical protein